MNTKCLLRSVGVWCFISVAGVAVWNVTQEPQVSAKDPKQAETIRSLVHDRETGTYSLRTADK